MAVGSSGRPARELFKTGINKFCGTFHGGLTGTRLTGWEPEGATVICKNCQILTWMFKMHV